MPANPAAPWLNSAVTGGNLWDAVQDALANKAPPRRHPTNEPQQALLRNLLKDPEGRPMVPTYGSKGTRRYAYYETRKDLAKSGDPAALRVQRGMLDKYVCDHLAALLADEHELRRISEISEAESLRTMFAAGRQLAARLDDSLQASDALHSLVEEIRFNKVQLNLTLMPQAVGIDDQACWGWSIPRPARKPFRETKLRLDPPISPAVDQPLVNLLREARKVQELALGSGLTLLQLEKREGRCRKQMARLLRVSWLSPHLCEAILDGRQPCHVTRKLLLGAELPLDWADQERLLRFAA